MLSAGSTTVNKSTPTPASPASCLVHTGKRKSFVAGVCISEEDVSGRVLAGNRWSSDGSTEELIGGLLGRQS